MVGAGIKSSFRCKQIQSGKINICSTLAPKLSLIGGKPDHTRVRFIHVTYGMYITYGKVFGGTPNI